MSRTIVAGLVAIILVCALCGCADVKPTSNTTHLLLLVPIPRPDKADEDHYGRLEEETNEIYDAVLFYLNNKLRKNSSKLVGKKYYTIINNNGDKKLVIKVLVKKCYFDLPNKNLPKSTYNQLFKNNVQNMLTAVGNTEKMDVAAVIGHPYSDQALPASEVYNDHKIVFITPTASNPEVTQHKPFAFSMIYNDGVQTAYLQEYLKNQIPDLDTRRKNIIVVWVEGDQYSRGLRNLFFDHVDYGDWETVKDMEIWYPYRNVSEYPMTLVNTEEEFEARLREKLKAMPKNKFPKMVLLFAHETEATNLIKKIQNASQTTSTDKSFLVNIVGTDALTEKKFLKALKSHNKRLSFCTPFLYEMGTKDSRRFRENYRREPSINEAFAYDAAQLVVESIRRASIEPGAKTVTTSMRTFLEGLNSNRNSLDGITGKLYFSKKSRNIVRSGTMAYFKPRTGKIVPYPYVFLAEGVETAQGANKNDTSIGKNEELPKKNSDEKRRSRQLKIEKMPIINIGIAVDAIHDIDVSKNAYGLDFFLSVSNTADVEIKYPEEMFKLGRLHSGSSPLEGNYLFSTNDGGSKNHFLVRKKPKEEYPSGNNKGETNKYIKKKVLKYSETFEGDFDLYKFPFDSQVLKFEVTLDNDYGRKLVFWKDFFTLAPEIKLSKFWKSPRPMEKDIWAGFKLNTLPYIREFDAFDVSGNMTPVYQTQIKIARKWSPYVFSLFVPLAILLIVGMLSLEISPHRFPVRITLAVTTLLSMVVHHLSQLQPVRAVGQISVADILYVCLYGVMLCVIAGLISVNRRYTGEMSRLGLKEDDIFVPIPDTENYNVAVKILMRYIVVVVVCVVITLWKMQ